jgi:hypothetical protein
MPASGGAGDVANTLLSSCTRGFSPQETVRRHATVSTNVVQGLPEVRVFGEDPGRSSGAWGEGLENENWVWLGELGVAN